MAVFLINICKFNGCGIKFDSLGELITHIENIHIDYDPQVVEQKEQSQPSCLPLSYVLRFITDAARKDGPFLTTTGTDLKRKMAIKHHSYSMSSSNRSNTPTGSEMDEEEMMVSESENSNESWTTEEFSSEFIMRYGSRHSGTLGNSASNEKPFACPVPGCKKRYKNVNGIKYHSKNGHKKEGKVRKGFKCYCGKSYKTSQGLKNHSILAHNNASTETLNTNASSLISVATSPSTSSSSSSLSQSRSLSPSSVSGGSCNSINQSQLSPSPSTNTFGLITLKTSVNVSNGNGVLSSLTPSSNKNKLMKMLPESRYDSNANKHSTGKNATVGGVNGNGNDNGVKINLPSLVNLGILTPATSPKQQTQPNSQQVTSPILSTSNGQSNAGSDNNNSILPLTPISPNMSKNVNFSTSNGNGGNNGIGNGIVTTAVISDKKKMSEDT